MEVFPEEVKAICLAYTVSRGSCPYDKTVLVADNPDIVETFDFIIESIVLSTVDYAKEQYDPDINIVIQYVTRIPTSASIYDLGRISFFLVKKYQFKWWEIQTTGSSSQIS